MNKNTQNNFLNNCNYLFNNVNGFILTICDNF